MDESTRDLLMSLREFLTKLPYTNELWDDDKNHLIEEIDEELNDYQE